MITVEQNKICYIFDVDGTLTEHRQKMDPYFTNELKNWMVGRQCFIATGSDFAKTKEQVPESILNMFQNIFCCMGNEVREGDGKIISKSKFVIPDSLNDDLADFLKKSDYPVRTGMHLEFRTGMVNFSIVGRNANQEQRSHYNLWDQENQERRKIADFINDNYPTLNASVGGSISIDILEEGQDKGQIIHHLENAGAQKIVFVGDRCYQGGNDWGIIRELKKSNLAFEWYQVTGPKDTLALLRINKVFDGGK